jgi:hypothetical protein
MARDVMILMQANPFQGHWKGWALKIETFWGPEMAILYVLTEVLNYSYCMLSSAVAVQLA